MIVHAIKCPKIFSAKRSVKYSRRGKTEVGRGNVHIYFPRAIRWRTLYRAADIDSKLNFRFKKQLFSLKRSREQILKDLCLIEQ